jgi:uncharacterized protein YbjT (DUF2867 family)
LKQKNLGQIVAMYKHEKNAAILRQFHPDIRIITEDLAEPGSWEWELEDCTHLVCGHAQIGGLHREEFVRNDVDATARLLEAAKRNHVGYIVNISSSVINSMAIDYYTETKKAQEALIAASGIPTLLTS